MTYGDDPFTYKTETIPISKSTYARLANAINASGFWDEPFYRECDNLPTDAGGFTLEVNTPSRYKVVEAGICPGYIRRFHKAWQKVVDYIKKGNRLSLVWKDDVIRVD